jgi:hypothetical protein
VSQDPLWYKDAVFYELHVKAFQDSNGDGIGDFNEMIERLVGRTRARRRPGPASSAQESAVKGRGGRLCGCHANGILSQV